MAATSDSALSPFNVGFTAADVQRAREYHRPLYAVGAVNLILAALVLALAAFGPLGDALFAPLDDLPWWGAALAYPALLVAVLALIGLPLRLWAGWARERRFGLSTQSLDAWFGDWLKSLAVEIVLAAAALGGLLALAHALPSAWPIVAAPVAAGIVVLLSFVAPVVLEPIFNHFEPLADERLASGLRALATRANVPVQDVLVADASRRTSKQGAYVSGLGGTCRVVVYDTLLDGADERHVRVVVAHELGHRRDGHVVKLTVGAAAVAALAMIALWALLHAGAVLNALGANGPGDPRVIPFVLLAGLALQVLILPPFSAVSRRLERAADHASVELTGDLVAYEETHRNLARSNVSDLDPPRAVYLASFTHPTAPERIAAGRALAATAR